RHGHELEFRAWRNSRPIEAGLEKRFVEGRRSGQRRRFEGEGRFQDRQCPKREVAVRAPRVCGFIGWRRRAEPIITAGDRTCGTNLSSSSRSRFWFWAGRYLYL